MESEINTKKTAKNIIKVSLSNVIKLLAGVLVSFLLPRIIGITDYGYYKTFTLYSTYVGLLHFGFADGIYLKYGGKNYEELDKQSFRMYSVFLISLEFLIMAVLTAISFFSLSGDARFIIICLGLYAFSNNVANYYQIISQITNRFNELSIRYIIFSVLNSCSIVALWIIGKYTSVVVSYKLYTIIYVSINVFLMTWYIFTYREISFGKRKPIKGNFKEIFAFFIVGIPLLVANLCSSLILAIDRQFVNILFDKDVYAVYSFAYSMLALIATALAAISTVLYPTLKRIDSKTLRKKYSSLIKTILIIVFACLVVYFPLIPFINWFLPQYNDSLGIFRIILPGLGTSSAITIVMHNYYKTDGKEMSFFVKSAIVLVISIVANYVAFSIFGTTASISIASVGVMLVWYLFIEERFIRLYKVKWLKNIGFLLSMTAAFYLITINKIWWLSMIIYIISFIAITVLFYWNDFRKMFKNKQRLNPNESSNNDISVLVTGAAGQLGFDVINELSTRGFIAVATDVRDEGKIINKANWKKYFQCDITSKDQVTMLINEVGPDVIIHCAAWTDVDGSENSNNRLLVKKINVDGTDNLVKAAKDINAKFLYISTDYVFNGEGTIPWKPDDKDYAPLNYYGQTKLEGELSVSSQLDKYFIVRIAWVFGLNGNNFIKTMLKLADKGYKELRVVDDQIGTPTYTKDLARLLVDMIQTDKYGYYHATNEGGYISWADFAEEIFEQANKDVKVNRVTTEEYGVSIAKRPFNSRLDKSKLMENGFEPLPEWKNALERFLKELFNN